MHYIKSGFINEAYEKMCYELDTNGRINSPRGLKTIEIDDAIIEISNIENMIINIPEFKTPQKYLNAEMNWYLNGGYEVEEIGKAAPFWKGIVNPDGKTVNSNYGMITLKEKILDGRSQIEWCIDSLKKDPYTRQATMTYNNLKHKFNENRDFVCTMGQQFIQRDGKLDNIVWMRSQDIRKGVPFDFYWFSFLHKLVSDKTGIPVGKYVHHSTSLHAYENDWELVKSISKRYEDGLNYKV